MKNLTRKSVLLSAAALVGIVASATAPAFAADRAILRCAAQGAGDISMAAKYEVRGARKKFSVEMEAAPTGRLVNGQRIVFVVAGVNVAADRLARIVGGDLVGEVNFDTRARAGDDEVPFPRNFPAVGKGTQVRITSGARAVLGCTLR